jgi:hypothetical protein
VKEEVMAKMHWTWNRLFRIGNRIERRTSRKSRRRDRVRDMLERGGSAPRRFSRLRTRLRRISRRIERVETRRQEVLRALKRKWLDERDRISG